MSNKKRINSKIHSIQRKKELKIFSLACKNATIIINRAIEVSRNYINSGGLIPYCIYSEKIIDSHGDEIIIPMLQIIKYTYPEQS
ncbi:hypothetical protein CRS_26290 [Chryseobacterium sp. ON_d1]|nr:hypothetical protein CRS_26290 [Chryseobacterium sp. ON_d1]